MKITGKKQIDGTSFCKYSKQSLVNKNSNETRVIDFHINKHYFIVIITFFIKTTMHNVNLIFIFISENIEKYCIFDNKSLIVGI